MSILHAIILGIVEGITEFLPISSTGHLILASKLLGLAQTEFLKSFEIAIQLGAILSVVYLYWRKVFANVSLIGRVAAGFVPTAIIGLIFYRSVKAMLESHETVLWSLLVGGLVLIAFELWQKDREAKTTDLDSISYTQALIIGTFQSISIIPGVSRAAATILGGMALGLSRKTVVEFSFLLAIPTMAAATGLDLVRSASQFNSADFGVLAIGFITSFIVAIISIKFLLKFVEKSDFIPFGIYRILAALLFWLFVF
jgi:undecaprenyl-diphosphatase